MENQVKIDPACREPNVLVCTHAMTDEVQAILQALAQAPPQLLPGFREGTLELLEPQDLLRVYAAGGKVFAVTPAGEFQLRLRLYEAEARLDKTVFVRISHSEIINLRKAKAFDLRLSGTISVRLADGSVSYVSRRYVARIKQLLGV